MAKAILFLLMLPSILFATERIVSTNTPLYETSRLSRQKVRILSGSRIQIIQHLNTKSKVKIISEPSLSGRRNRSGTIGWIQQSHYAERTRRVITRDELFDTVERSSTTLSSHLEPRVEQPCISCEQEEESPTGTPASSSMYRFQAGCEELKLINNPSHSANQEKLEQCVNSLISLASRRSRIAGVYRGVGGREFPKIDRHKFFSSLSRNLNPLEKNFIGHILTLSGEAYGLTSMTRLNSPRNPPHLQEMAAISMVLENRKNQTIALAEERKENLTRLKRKYRLSLGSSDEQVYQKMDQELASLRREKKQIEDNSRRMQTRAAVAEARERIQELREQITELDLLKKEIKRHKNKKSTTTALDIALDGNGKQFSMYSKIEPSSSRTPNYPHWFKAISPDFRTARRTSIRGYLSYLKSKSSYPTDVVNYYSTVMRTPPSWARSGGLENRTIRVGRTRLNSDPAYASNTYQCGRSRQGASSSRKVGHCFYSGDWFYSGHPFGGP